ncbi:MAG: sigma-70 family RNA polymerase sigma factor [Treponemataceae bacterium]|nr:sigma-70 family RNA polymerase sigma factor [Treponemataceae bacterium]
MDDAIYTSYIKQILKYPLLSFEEEIEHSKRIQTGDEQAQLRLVQANLRLVVSIAKKYEHFGLNLMDLIQEGNIGLLTAAKKYHYSYGTRFSTYAYAWISQAITRYIHGKASMISLPLRKDEVVRKMYAAKASLYQTLGREATTAELAERLNLPEEELIQAEQFSYTVMSIDARFSDDSEKTLGEVIPDLAPTPETDMLVQTDYLELQELLDNLKPLERQVVRYRYNLANCDKPLTLRQIGEQLGVSAETVRQTEMRAIKKMQSMAEEKGIVRTA